MDCVISIHCLWVVHTFMGKQVKLECIFSLLSDVLSKHLLRRRQRKQHVTFKRNTNYMVEQAVACYRTTGNCSLWLKKKLSHNHEEAYNELSPKGNSLLRWNGQLLVTMRWAIWYIVFQIKHHDTLLSINLWSVLKWWCIYSNQARAH